MAPCQWNEDHSFPQLPDDQGPAMLNFEIPNMTCGHCVRAITEAVHAADPAAKVQADLQQHRVQVETSAAREAVATQLVEAGYAPA
jgi:copper chaperone